MGWLVSCKLRIFVGCLLGLVSILAGCRKSPKSNKSSHGLLKNHKKIDIQEFLAQHSEIPDPLFGFELFQINFDQQRQQAVEIVYKPKKQGSSLSLLDVQKAYNSDMELLGWKCIGIFEGEEIIQMLFERPKLDMICSLQIQKNLEIRLTFLKKREACCENKPRVRV